MFFAQEAFRTVNTNGTYRELLRLDDVSHVAPAAADIERIALTSSAGRVSGEQLENHIFNPSLTSDERRDITRRMQSLGDENEAHFVERSGVAGIVLAAAIPAMPKLRYVLTESRCFRKEGVWPRSRGLPSSERSTSQAFSSVISALALTGKKLHSLRVRSIGYGVDSEGISLRALCVPWELLPCFFELKELRLTFETTEPSEYT